MTLLTKFLAALFPPRETEALVRNTTEEEALRLMSPSVISPDTVALLSYKLPVVAALIIEAKYHGNEHAFSLLGKVLAAYLEEFVADEDLYEKRTFRLVPIPLSSMRKQERRYNQAERIAASALSYLGLPGTPSTHLLERVRDTRSQTRLSRAARLTNMKDAFAAKDVDVACTYLLIDDVVTTGATLSSAAAALRRAGATRVICVALAH